MTFLCNLCGLPSRGKVVDFVQDIISSGTCGEVAAEQLKSAEIPEITELSQAISMKPAKNFAHLLGGYSVIASRTNNRLQW